MAPPLSLIGEDCEDRHPSRQHRPAWGTAKPRQLFFAHNAVPEAHIWLSFCRADKLIKDWRQQLVPLCHELVLQVKLQEAVNLRTKLLPVRDGAQQCHSGDPTLQPCDVLEVSLQGGHDRNCSHDAIVLFRSAEVWDEPLSQAWILDVLGYLLINHSRSNTSKVSCEQCARRFHDQGLLALKVNEAVPQSLPIRIHVEAELRHDSLPNVIWLQNKFMVRVVGIDNCGAKSPMGTHRLRAFLRC
mmetsp:Transcript_62990/g.117137  ORF Transcript_62990/g.117137 Transcript_62990/m.117137 type:complete len:243 (-) Transcript_62990:281-1009(-)